MIEARMRAVADSRPGEAPVARQRRSSVVLPLAAAVSGMVLLVGCSSGSIGYSARPSLSAGPSSLATPLAGQPAEQILTEAIRAVRVAGSVHVVAHDAAGSKKVTFIDDVSATVGREVIRTNGGGRATFLMIAGVGYLRGNAAALENYYGIRAPVAAQLSGRWISVHHGDRGYQQLTSQVTLSGFIDEIKMEAPLARRGSSLVGNQPAVVVQGTASAANGAPRIKETLYVASTGRPLPLRLVGHVPGERLRAMFGNWGEALHLAPPATSIPISSLTS
jgi:hypothetical protein